MKILIIEDEPGLQLGLTDLFEGAGYRVRVRGEGGRGLEAVREDRPDLVILDLGLPDMDGTRVLEKLRDRAEKLPVLVLTARASDGDIIEGFRLGAFDYVTKPYSPKVLLARAEALLRRSGSTDRLQLGAVTIDFARYEATRDDAPLHLTTREIDLLRFLNEHEGKPVSRHDILDEVWGMHSDAGARTVDTHVAMLRKKVEPNPDRPTYILSQRGIGYKLVAG